MAQVAGGAGGAGAGGGNGNESNNDNNRNQERESKSMTRTAQYLRVCMYVCVKKECIYYVQQAQRSGEKKMNPIHSL